MKNNRWLSLIFVAVLVAAQAGCHYAALDPSGLFAYVMDNNEKLLVYQIDPATGFPTVLWNYAPGSAVQPYAQAQISDQIPIVDPSGRFLYLELKLTTGATILEYQINQATHELSLLPTAVTWSTDVGINGLTVDPLGRFLFVSGNGGLLSYSIDPRSGQLTQNGAGWFSTGGTSESPVADPNGRFVFAMNSTAINNGNPGVVTFSVNPDGTLQKVSGPFLPTGVSGPESMTIDQTGSFMVITDDDANPGSIYTARVDRKTGALTSVGTPVAAKQNVFGPAFDRSNQYVYAMSGDKTVLTYAFDPSTATLTPGTPTSPLGGGLQQVLVNGLLK